MNNTLNAYSLNYTITGSVNNFVYQPKSCLKGNG